MPLWVERTVVVGLVLTRKNDFELLNGVGWRKATTDRISDPHFQVAIVGWMRDDGVVAVALGVDDSNVVWVCDIH